MTKQEKARIRLQRKANRGPGFSNYARNELGRIIKPLAEALVKASEAPEDSEASEGSKVL